MKIHPILIGIINALIPGAGYLIVGERKTFGWLLLAGVLLFFCASFTEPNWWVADAGFYTTTLFGHALEAVSYGLMMLAFGYDAYVLAAVRREPPLQVS